MQDIRKGAATTDSFTYYQIKVLGDYFSLVGLYSHILKFANDISLYFRKRSRKNRSFDARTIIKCYGSEEWGEYLIREAHLSQRFAYDENGYYRCCASIPFPSDSQLD